MVAASLPVLAIALGCNSERAAGLAPSAAGGLVFVRSVDGQTDLFRARLSDGAVEPLLSTADVEEVWPYWSDAAGMLLFQHRAVGAQAYDLSLWSTRSGVVPLVVTADRDEQWPDWSPDGSRVVFAQRGGATAPGLAWVDVATRAETVIARSNARDVFYRPSFDAAGLRVVAQRRDAQGRGSTLWIAARDAAPQKVTRESGCEELKPFFTRDGASIVFTRQCGAAPREVMRADAAGAVTALPGVRAGADEHSARPSPTRDEVAFVSDRNGARDVFLVPLAGGEPVNLTDTPDRDEFAPRWSPDGERLVLTSAPRKPPGREGDRLDPRTTRLVVVDRNARILFETEGLMPDWMPPPN